MIHGMAISNRWLIHGPCQNCGKLRNTQGLTERRRAISGTWSVSTAIREGVGHQCVAGSLRLRGLPAACV